MRKVEAEARRQRRTRRLHDAVLVTIGIAGIMAFTAIAPNALRLLEVTGINARLRYRTKTVLGRLKQDGNIEFIERDGQKYVRLTKKGGRTLDLYKEKLRLQERLRKRWDKRYRLIIFDVPEKRKKIRDKIRYEFSQVGFLRVQDSAWLYPYDCEEFVALLKAELHIGKDVLYAVIESIENDAWIRKHFNLPID